MAFQVRTDRRATTSNLDGTVYVLEDAGGPTRADVWPALGFNCFHWQAGRQGQPVSLLYADPQLFDNGRPTRSGIPVLFPFPNRIRAGRFRWEGKDYQLPLNSLNVNAIHGFACQRPWRVVDQGADARSAWLTGEFWGSKDAPDTKGFWPADYRLRLTYRLTADRLRAEAVIDNPDRTSLPFGLGYHPYFRLPALADAQVQVPARAYWELHESLPTGARHLVDSPRDLRSPRRYSDLNLDDVLTGVEQVEVPNTGGLCSLGSMKAPSGQPGITVLASPAFREVVVFTPPHREAFCLEPYTCTTDAVNLQQQGADAGLLVLQPGEKWTGIVEMVL
jgi:aldose 1-epimerase